MEPWYYAWWFVIPVTLLVWGLGVAKARADHQRYLRKLESGEIQPPPPKPMPRIPDGGPKVWSPGNPTPPYRY
jgi:hypothetical protein